MQKMAFLKENTKIIYKGFDFKQSQFVKHKSILQLNKIYFQKKYRTQIFLEVILYFRHPIFFGFNGVEYLIQKINK